MHEFSNQTSATKVLYLLHAIVKKQILTYHHGNEISIDKTSYGKRSNSEKSTILLFDSHNSNYMKKMGYDKQYVIGYPIFFPEWIEIVNDYCTELNYQNQTILIYSRHVNERYMDLDKYIELLSSTLRVIRAKFKNISIVIKPHPREDIQAIHKIIKSQNILNVTISYEHPAVLAKNAKMAITFWGSVILESLSMGVPTVEYYIEADKFREDYPNGSNYKAIGIHSVSDEKGLERFVDSVIDNSYELPLIVNEFKKLKNTEIFFT
jgi:UDP-N-acetylglucosamine 2-epimerase